MSYIFILLHCFILLRVALYIVQSFTSSALQLPLLCIVSIIDALMPNPSVATILQLERECEAAAASSFPCGFAIFHGERGSVQEKKIFESSSMHVWGRIWRRTSTYHGTTLAEIRGPS